MQDPPTGNTVSCELPNHLNNRDEQVNQVSLSVFGFLCNGIILTHNRKLVFADLCNRIIVNHLMIDFRAYCVVILCNSYLIYYPYWDWVQAFLYVLIFQRSSYLMLIPIRSPSRL